MLSVAAGLALALALLAVWALGAWVEERSLADLRRTAEGSGALRMAFLSSEINKQRVLPLVLADDAELKEALRSRDPGAMRALDQKLETLAAGAQAADLYVLDAKGDAVAASNWRAPTSFVGSHYAFRPYFLEAVKRGAAEYFALGTVSLHPGLYISRRVNGPDGLLGVVVVKLQFDRLEQAWRAAGDPAFVVDREGVVLITSEPAWRFHTLGELDPARRAALRSNLQFGDAPLEPLPLQASGNLLRRSGQGGPDVLDSSIPSGDWTLHLLTPVTAAEQAAAAARWIMTLAGALIALAAAWMWRRGRRAKARAAEAAANRVALEQAVRTRTEALSHANAQLSSEMQERERAEARLQVLQSELVQANKLASLGQIAAGVAHEINQPVSAIRAYSDNAVLLLAKGRNEDVKTNLSAIGDLTERVGSITDELRAFSRRATGRLEPTSVAEAIEGSLLLTNSRVRRRTVRILRPQVDPALRARAERVRLEQILVNLLQNAFEALEDVAEPQIRVDVDATDTEISITVADNGPGLAPEVAENLFLPFVTTKPRGVGLGLVISREIAIQFEGRLGVDSRPGEGAAFTVTLPRAP